MKKAALLFLLVVLLSFSGSAKLNSTIAKDCPTGYEPIISMANPNESYSNPGTPSQYEYQVCVKGITETRFGDQCRSTPAFYLSSNTTYAHVSKVEGYNLKVCAGRMATRVRSSCMTNQTPLFAISDKINGFGRHVAGIDDSGLPKAFSKVMCGFYRPPENVSISMNFNLSSTDEVYFDGQQKDAGWSYSGLAEYPYLVSTSGSHTAGLVASEFIKAERTLQEKNTLTLKKKSSNADFLIPFTKGGYENIEDDQKKIVEGSFLNQMLPSFSFFQPSEATVRTILQNGVDLRSNLSIGKGSYSIEIVKTGENQITITQK